MPKTTHTLHIAVCVDKVTTGECKTSVDADPSQCSDKWIKENCQFTCGLCPSKYQILLFFLDCAFPVADWLGWQTLITCIAQITDCVLA